MIHRKLQNVVYMKKIDVKKKGGMGNQRHHRVLSTSTCDLEECLTLRPCYVQHLHTLLCLLVVTCKPNFYFQAKLVNNYMYYISIKFCICLLIQDQGYLISD